MRILIYTKVRNTMHSFFLTMGDKEYYLFSQAFRRGVDQYFCKGVSLEKARDFSKSHNDKALIRTMEKILMYLKYWQREMGVSVFTRGLRNKRLIAA